MVEKDQKNLKRGPGRPIYKDSKSSYNREKELLATTISMLSGFNSIGNFDYDFNRSQVRCCIDNEESFKFSLSRSGVAISVTRLGNLLYYVQLFKAFVNN